MSVRNYIEVCELNLPDDTVRAAPASFSSMNRGHFSGLVKSYGPVEIVTSDRSGALAGLETTVDIYDLDRSILARVEGQYAPMVVGSSAARYLADPADSFAAWRPIFDGIVTKHPETVAPGVLRFTLRVDDVALEGDAPRRSWTVNRQTWPNAHPDAIGQIGPRVYGEHAATNFEPGRGFLPTLYVDTVSFRYAVAIGRMKSVDTVYVDDVVTGSGFSVDYLPDRRGQVWTIITFSSDQGDAVITCDGKGYEADGDGAGALITAPDEILLHALSNWHFGNWRNGVSWLATSARIGATATDLAAFLAGRMPEASPYYGAVSGYALLKDFCDQHGVRAYWSPAGLLEFCFEDVAVSPYDGTDIDWERDVYDFSHSYDDINAGGSVQIEQARSAASGRYSSSFGVTLPDPERGGPIAADVNFEPLPLLWSPAS